MNLKQGGGLVPLRNNNPSSNAPYLLVEFPNQSVFRELYRKGITDETLSKYWNILQSRLKGSTLDEAGRPYGLSRERVRQIEAKFIRSYTRRLLPLPKPSSMID
jgi:transcriptional regulator of heat shock response